MAQPSQLHLGLAALGGSSAQGLALHSRPTATPRHAPQDAQQEQQAGSDDDDEDEPLVTEDLGPPSAP